MAKQTSAQQAATVNRGVGKQASRTSRIGPALVVVISASFNIAAAAYKFPHWLGTVALIVMGASIALFALQSKTVTGRIPWELRRKDPLGEVTAMMHANHSALRRELQRQFGAFNALKKPTAAQLRTAAHTMAQTLTGSGYATSAKAIEVHLPDDAQQSAIGDRKEEIFWAVGRMLMWDEFQ